MPSSMSSLSPDPTVSVVIGSNASAEALEACLAALEGQRDGVEALVFEAARSSQQLRERFPWARFELRPDALVPELWRDGIDAAGGEIVALTISQMVPAPNWIESIRAEHRSHDAVGGAIDPGSGLRLRDWGEYFCRYARDMRPFVAHEYHDLPGDNASYKRELLHARRDLYRQGFWEPVFHPPLRRDGIVLWQTPELVVEMGRSAGWSAFVHQRLEHGRRYGHQRGTNFSRGRNLAGVLAAPVVPFLMSFRVLRQVAAKKRYRLRFVAALPVIFSFNVVWAYAEARGHADMVGRS